MNRYMKIPAIGAGFYVLMYGKGTFIWTSLFTTVMVEETITY